MLTDHQIADSYRKWKKRHYPHAKPEKPKSYLLQYLRKATWYQVMHPLEQSLLMLRVLHIVRSEAGMSGAETRRKRKAHERAKQLAQAQIEFSFIFEHNHDT